MNESVSATNGRNAKERLEAILRRPVTTSADARRAAEAAGLLADLLEIEARAVALDAEAAGVKEEAPSYGGDLEGLPLHEAARRVLLESGLPLHAREIGARMKARGWRHPRSPRARPEQIVYQLAARLPRLPDTFRRVAPNTFALVDAPQPKRPRPRTGLFSGPAISELIGESEEPMEASDWRSS
jgi:hypothetical protein